MTLARWIAQLPVSRKGRLVVLAPLAFQLLFLVLLGFVEHQHTVEAKAALDVATAEAHLDRLVGHLDHAEAAMRGHILTGDASFSAAFEESERLFRVELQSIDRYASPAAEAFQRDAERVFELDHRNRQLIAAGKLAAVIVSVERLEGKRLMDSARANAERVVDDERRLQLELSRRSHRSRVVLLGMIGSGMAMNVVIAFAIAGFFGSSITRRLEHVLENTRRLDRDEELIALDGGDEIAVLDRDYRRVAMALRERTQRAEEINRELETFSYSVSHDLRAPVRAIGGYARLLAEDYEPRLQGEGAEFVEIIRKEADQMARVIDDLLELSRTASRSLSEEPIDIGARAAAEVERLRIAEPARDVEFTVGALPPARGDVEMVGRVVSNLIGNAWKYTRERSTARIEMGGHAENGMALYFVRDNGAGFDMRYAGKLFLIFERLHPSNEFEGTGIGLALVERIITRHGGKVWGEGSPGEGATFYFTLPAAKESA